MASIYDNEILPDIFGQSNSIYQVPLSARETLQASGWDLGFSLGDLFVIVFILTIFLRRLLAFGFSNADAVSTGEKKQSIKIDNNINN